MRAQQCGRRLLGAAQVVFFGQQTCFVRTGTAKYKRMDNAAPVTMMYSMTPQDQTSLELPSKKLCISASGAVYASVPSALFGSLFTWSPQPRTQLVKIPTRSRPVPCSSLTPLTYTLITIKMTVES